MNRKTSALPSEADIQLILVKGSANDPKRTLRINYEHGVLLTVGWLSIAAGIVTAPSRFRHSSLASVATTGFTILVMRSIRETQTAMDDASLAGPAGENPRMERRLGWVSLRRWYKRILWVSMIVWLIGFIAAYSALPVRMYLD